MDLQRMLEKCHVGQWSPDDLDWRVTPRALSREDETAVCQYFTDMAGIELLAAALFEVQRDHATDPVLRAIFETFVEDERRHAEVAARLAAHYDVHRYRRYEVHPSLAAFRGAFVDVLHHVSPEIANAYITTGELLLDVALLRSLNDFVDDEMSHQAMARINRDESRHIAVDYHMVAYYAAPAWAEEEARLPKKSLRERAQAARAMTVFLYRAGPFIQEVFFEPMDLVDPSGRRLYEAFKRAQLLGRKPEVAARPFPRFIQRLQDLYQHPIVGRAFGPVLQRAIGLDPRVIRNLFTEEEERNAMRMSFDELAQDALAAKHAS